MHLPQPQIDHAAKIARVVVPDVERPARPYHRPGVGHATVQILGGPGEQIGHPIALHGQGRPRDKLAPAPVHDRVGRDRHRTGDRAAVQVQDSGDRIGADQGGAIQVQPGDRPVGLIVGTQTHAAAEQFQIRQVVEQPLEGAPRQLVLARPVEMRQRRVGGNAAVELDDGAGGGQEQTVQLFAPPKTQRAALDLNDAELIL